MLTTLKDIFRPTWKKVVWTVVLGVPITLLGLYAEARGVPHSLPLLFIAFICLLPNAVMWLVVEVLLSLNAPELAKLILLPILQLLYFYTIVCLLLSLQSRTSRSN